MSPRNLWIKEELILVFNLYLKMPFGQMSSTNKEIINMADLIGRSANAVALRLVNFASVDPVLKARGIKGMIGGIKQVQPIWDEFFENQEELVFLSEKILAEREKTSIEAKYNSLLTDLSDLQGENVARLVKTRVNQSVFRKMVLANYSNTCAVTGINIPDLLVASHIVPWSVNEKERLNPENGICFSPLIDKAFDKGFIGVKNDGNVILSSKLKSSSKSDYYTYYFKSIENKKLADPIGYYPRKEFLEYHLDIIFEK